MIKIKVSELMRQKGWNATNLMQEAKIAYATALRLSKGNGEAISMKVLDSICKTFGVKVADVLEYIPDKRQR